MIKTTPPTSNAVTGEKEGQLNQRLKDLTLQTRENIVQSRAVQVGVSYVNLYGYSIAPEALALIAEKDAHEANAVCYGYTPYKEIDIATTDPHNEHLLALIARMGHDHKTAVRVSLTSDESLHHAFERYLTLPKVFTPSHGVDIPEEQILKFKESIVSVTELSEKFASVSLTDLIVLLMAASITADASDVHIEAGEFEIAIRFRIDGILHTVAKIDRERYRALVSRLKLLSNLKINVADRPQDGHVSLHLQGERVDVRVSTLPTAYGESVVMRLLKGNSIKLSFDDLGFDEALKKTLKEEIERPNGMIVVCGPTGSGKTTTLYAMLRVLNSPDTKIITIEDPIEYQLEGINQSQVEPDKDYTFVSGLRSIVRQDPDVILVGEMRDLETVDIALQAALTGHLVLSTLHTNDAAGAIPRFLSMGAKAYLLAPALNNILAQRLVRKLCGVCAVQGQFGEEYAERVKAVLASIPESLLTQRGIDPANLKYLMSKGCQKCQGLGYKGRVGIYEFLKMTSEIEQVILSGAISEYQIRDISAKAGMISMVQDGILKAMQGVTTVEEVFRVVQ